MNAPSMKDKIVETMQSLPADTTIEDAMERLLFLAKIERGLLQAEGGSTDVEAAWVGEIKRRAREVESGTAKLVDWEAAREHIVQRLKARR